jgi:hypothetical protein
MKTILFCNTAQPQCGVYQYGWTLCAILQKLQGYHVIYREYEHRHQFDEQVLGFPPDVVIYNWHPDQHGWMEAAPLANVKAKQILVYHDWDNDTSKFDAVLFSDPTMPDHDNWFAIPRPLPVENDDWTAYTKIPVGGVPVIGVHGFGGANAELVVQQAMYEFEHALVRLHLPYAHYGDTDGHEARAVAQRCLEMAKDRPTFLITVYHGWLTQGQLLGWLSAHHLNCYLRDTSARWRGVSSALDAAIAVRVPVAINRCQGFRHLFGCTPSICIEDRSLRDIVQSGLSPVQAFWDANQPQKLRERVQEILKGLNV